MGASVLARLRRQPWFCLVILLLLAALPGCRKGRVIEYEEVEKQKEERINSLRDQGATVTRKTYPLLGNGYAVNLSGAQIADDTFRKLKELQRLTELDLSKSSIADRQMDQLNDLATWLIQLDLSYTAITDAGLEKLTNLNMCLNLNLAGTKVTAAAADRFKNERLAHRPAAAKGKLKQTMNIQLR